MGTGRLVCFKGGGERTSMLGGVTVNVLGDTVLPEIFAEQNITVEHNLRVSKITRATKYRA